MREPRHHIDNALWVLGIFIPGMGASLLLGMLEPFPLFTLWVWTGIAMLLLSQIRLRVIHVELTAILWMTAFVLVACNAFAGIDVFALLPYLFIAIGVIVLYPLAFVLSSWKRLNPWLCTAVLLTSLLAYAAGEGGGPESMYSFWENWGFTQLQAELVTHFIRKTIHFVFYGVVGWTFFRGMLAAKRDGELVVGLLQWAAGLAMLWVMVNAGFDEFRQYSTPNRTGQISDVALDLAGAGTFIGLSVWRIRRREMRSRLASPPF